MNLIVKPSSLSGTIAVPGSKSHTIRAVAMAMMAEGVSRISAPLVSEDTLSAIGAGKAFGMTLDRGDDSVWTAAGLGGKLRKPAGAVDMANSGTSVKLFAALAALAEFPVVFDGDSSLRNRPMGSLLNALKQCDVQIESADEKCPFKVQGPIQGGRRIIVNGKSSQYVSAMLFAAPFTQKGLVIDVEDVNEQPYIDMTLLWMRRLGLQVTASADDSHFEVPGGQTTHGFSCVIPADFSTAAFPLIAAAVTKSKLTILNLDFQDVQGDKAVFGYLEQMGAKVERLPGRTIVEGGSLHGAELDLNATPDALPAIAVAAAFASGTTRIYHAAQARIKETDRIACMTRELRKIGITVSEQPDGMTITGGLPKGADLESYGDHRIAMALACAGLGARGISRIHGAECAAVTYPAFFTDFQKTGAGFCME